MSSQRFEDVEVWQKAHRLVLDVYCITKRFPREELLGLTSQFRRAAVSIPANFAEGFVKRGRAVKLRFYNIAQGSLEECRYYCRLAKDLEYGDTEVMAGHIDEISRMFEAYCRTIAATHFRSWSLILAALSAFSTGSWLLATGY